jgi:gamma-glutamylcyclotransferase (GGCT)/AIG2-like uncharacterized protein YtfP
MSHAAVLLLQNPTVIAPFSGHPHPQAREALSYSLLLYYNDTGRHQIEQDCCVRDLMNIFTYGSLMYPSVMRAVTGREFPSKKVRVQNYARFKVKGESYPGLTPFEDALTEGVLYMDVDAISVSRLDDFEGELYERSEIPVEGEALPAQTYVIKARYRDRLSAEAWDPKPFEKDDLLEFMKTYRGFANTAALFDEEKKG